MPERLTFNHGAAVAVWPQPPAPVRVPEARPQHLAEPRAGREPRPTLAYWAAWAFTALLFFRPQDTFTALEPVHLSEVVAVIGLVSLFAGRISAGQPLVRWTPELVGVLGLAVVMLVTVPFSIWPGGAFNAFTDMYVKVALIFLLLTHSARNLDMLRRLTWLLVVAVGYVALRGVFDYVRGVNVRDGRLWGPVIGLMGNPNDFAMNMVTFLPFAVVAALGRNTVFRRAIAALACVAMLAVIVFTRSRAGMLGLAVMAVVLVVQAGRIRRSLVAWLVVGSLLAVPAMPRSVWTRLATIVGQVEDDSGSREERKQLMRLGWNTFLERPLTGVGVAQFRNYSPPGAQPMWRETHNVVLQILAELGIGGGVLFLFLMGCTVAAVAQTARLLKWDRRQRERASAETVAAFSRREAEQLRLQVAATTAAFAGWFTCAQFASIGYYWTYYYLLALIVIGREVARGRVRAARRGSAPAGGAT